VQCRLAFGELDDGGIAQVPAAAQLVREIPAVAQRAEQARGPRRTR
jgi:hypothetical protein